MKQLADQVALVTGGSKGWGAGIARHLKEQGARVYITGRDVGVLNRAASEWGVEALQADVVQGKDWDRVMERILSDNAGRLDILVNNAGGGGRIGVIEELSDDDISAAIALNLTGAILGCRRAVPVMKSRQSGTIVNISSGCAEHAWPGWSVYSAAKGGLVQFSRCLYAELRPVNVRVTSLIPYWGATDFLTAAGLAGHPAGEPDIRKKCIQPDDMGKLIGDIVSLPPHLVVPEMMFAPLVQEIVPF